MQAGAKARQSLERRAREEKEVTDDLAELVVRALPHLHHYRHLVAASLEQKVMAYLAQVGCPPGEYRHHPTGAARDRMASMVMRVYLYPDRGGKIPKEDSKDISLASAALAYLADEGVADEDEARKIIKKESIAGLAKAYSRTKNKPKTKNKENGQVTRQDQKSGGDVKNSPQEKNEEDSSEGLRGSVERSEPVQAGPPAPEEAPQSTPPSEGTNGTAQEEETVHDRPRNVTEARIEGSPALREANPADRQARLEEPDPRAGPEGKQAELDATIARDTAAALRAVGRQPNVFVKLQHSHPPGTLKGAVCRFVSGGAELYFPPDAVGPNTEPADIE
jgi:hypothetical protein